MLTHSLAFLLTSSVVFAQISITQPTADHWWVGGGLNTLAWTGSTPQDFQVFLVNADKNVLRPSPTPLSDSSLYISPTSKHTRQISYTPPPTPTQRVGPYKSEYASSTYLQSRIDTGRRAPHLPPPPSPTKRARTPPLGDPSLSYVSPKSNFIRLPSAKKSPKTVVLLDRSQSSIGKENQHPDTVGRQRKLSGGRTGALTERPVNVLPPKKRCLLTHGLAPMLQTDRLAIESIVPTYIKSKSINPGGATAAKGYTLELTNSLNLTDVYATSDSFEIKAPNSPYPPQRTDSPADSSSPSSSDNATTVSVSASTSASSSPDGAERHVRFEFGGPIVLGLAAFGWLMATIEQELNPRHWM